MNISLRVLTEDSNQVYFRKSENTS